MHKRAEIILIAICLFLVGSLMLASARINDETAKREFHVLAQENLKSLDTRMQTYLQSLRGALAFLHATPNPGREAFENFVTDLQIDRFLPGINGIGFIASIPAERSDDFERMARADGYQNFAIHPQTSSDQRYVIQHIFPLDRNAEALGLDITFEEGRRTAADSARETGEPRLTPRITLVQDAQKKAGFLLLLPLFEANTTGWDPRDKVHRFDGWVYAPFVGENLLRGLTSSQGKEFILDVYDGTAPLPENQIYAGALNPDQAGTYTTSFTLEKFGRPWTLTYTSTLAFDSRFSNLIPIIVMILGLGMTLLLASLMRNIRQRGEAARELAALRQRQVEASEEQTRSIADNKVTPVFILNADEEILSANKAASDCFATTVDRMVGAPFRQFVKERGVKPVTPSHNAQGMTGDGRELALNLQRNNWRTADGSERITTIVRDITSEVTTHEEIGRTKAMYDMALQGARIGVFELDLRSGTSEVSSTWLDIMGMEESDGDLATQRMFMSRIHPDDREALQREDERCIRGEIDRSVAEYRMRFGRDKWRWMRSDAVVSERGPDGKALRLIGTQMDITDLRHARNALEANEQQLRKLVSGAPIGMVVLDSVGRFVQMNDAFCDLCGATEDDLLTKYSIADFLGEEEIGDIRSKISEAIRSGSTIYVNDHRLMHVNGEERWGSFHISWAFDKNANDYLYIVQIIDVTEQKRLDRLKSEFVSTVSHELRTPLTSIKGALGLLQSSMATDLSSAHAKLLSIASSNTDRLTAIVNDILDLEKISSGEVNFHFDTVDLNELIEDTIVELGPFAQTHESKLVSQLPAQAPMLHADPSRLKQVLANLISNACKFSNKDSEVIVRTEVIGEEAIVYVQNFGPGVPDSFKDGIFKAFSQADSSDTRSKGGTGLGLNISRQIIHRHDGKIGFESKKDAVTVFWFTCPLAVGNAVKLPAAPNRALGVAAERPRILHIDPDRDFAEVIASGLSELADVALARTPEEARALMAEATFDAAIFDWSVTHWSETDFIAELKDHSPKIRLISLSADGERQNDTRLDASLVKTRSDVNAIVSLLFPSVDRRKSSRVS